MCIRVVATTSADVPSPRIVRQTANTGGATPVRPETALQAYTEGLISRFHSEGRARLTETYASTLRCFQRMMGSADLPLGNITPDVMLDFERKMLAQGLSRNTTSFYLRILRAIYNRAVGEGLTVDRRPFAPVFTGKMKTRKRALPIDALRRIAHLELQNPTEVLARRLFMLSYYTRGMSFVDLARLRKDNLRGGKLTYRRQKTGQLLTMAWRPEMQKLADELPSRDGSHLLGILDDRLHSPWRKQCHAWQQRMNEALKRIGERAGLQHPLTMYVARHSWASVAKQLHVPMSVISDGMGHHSERTTQIYLTDIDGGELDLANDLMISAVSSKQLVRPRCSWPKATAKAAYA